MSAPRNPDYDAAVTYEDLAAVVPSSSTSDGWAEWLQAKLDEAARNQNLFEGFEEPLSEHYYRGLLHAYRAVLERLGEPYV